MGYHPLSPVDERPCLAGWQALVHLGLRAEEPQDFIVRRLAGADLLERIARRDRAALAAALGRPFHVNARSKRLGDPSPQREEQRTGEIPEPEQKRRDQDGPPRQPAREVGEPDLQLLRRQAFRGDEREPERLRVGPRLTQAPGGRGGDELFDLQMAGVGEVHAPKYSG